MLRQNTVIKISVMNHPSVCNLAAAVSFAGQEIVAADDTFGLSHIVQRIFKVL